MASEQDIERFASEEGDVNELLIFTNGKGEPKCIDVNRCLSELDETGTLASAFADQTSSDDFVEACPRVPLDPITFNFGTEGPERSRFIDSKGVQFSYQAIYKKGFFSALAPYSNLAVPPTFFSAGTDSLSTIEKDVENVCILSIPQQSQEVIGVRLIFREGNFGVARVLEDIYFETEAQGEGSDNFVYVNNDTTIGTYSFKNDVTGYVMSETDRLKTFDNVPRKAFAQEVTEDRVVYGNYTEGYNNLAVDVRTEVEFGDAPPQGYDFKLKAIPTVFKRMTTDYTDLSPQDSGGYDYNTVPGGNGATGISNNRISEQMGFLLDDRDLPETVVGGLYEINISVSTKNNFHFFSGKNSIPSSLHNINYSGNEGLSVVDATEFVNFLEPSGALDYVAQAAASGMTSPAADVGSVAQEANSCSRNAALRWNSNNGDINSQTLVVGGCAQAPFIMKGGTLKFKAQITVPVGGVDKDTFMSAAVHALWGGNPTANPISNYGGQQVYPTSDNQWFHTHQFNLGLSNGVSISHETSSLSDLICAAGEWTHEEPIGYFIVNSASANFCLEPAMSPAGSTEFLNGKYYGETAQKGKYQVGEQDEFGITETMWGVKVTMANISQIDIKTCIPLPKNGFGSLISPSSYAFSQDVGIEVEDPNERIRAKRFSAIATSKWDYDGRTQADQTLVWPSTQRNLHLPGAGPQGPACRVWSSDPIQLDDLIGLEVEYTSTGGSLPMSGNVSVAEGAVSDFTNDFVEYSNGDGKKVWMPAPIQKWVVLDDAAATNAAYWQNSHGMTAYLDVEGGAFGDNPIIQGRARTLLPGVSDKWEGGLTNIMNAETGYSNILYSFNTYPNGNNFDELRSRSVFSNIDGSAGPGGASQFATRQFGHRGNGALDSWGAAITRGTHNLGASDNNVVGSHANVRGSVTAFTLMGGVDNMPGYDNNEIIRRGVTDFDLPDILVRNAMLRWNKAKIPFALVLPEMRTIVQIANNGLEVIETPESIPGTDAGTIRSIRVVLETSYGDPNFFDTQDAYDNGDNVYNTVVYGTNGVVTGSIINVSQVIGFDPEWGAGAPGTVLSSASSDGSALFTSSFKTKANHEFGIVYYDKKGRHGAVQPIKSVYVPGYDERNTGEYGPATIKFIIRHAPPSWAEHYRFVYAGNNNVTRFLQYTVDGAHVRPYEGGDGSNNIYVSLSSIQGNDVSFQSSYSAVNQDDGSKDLYSFAEGDFLRVISYQDTSGNVVYPSESWQFQIVDKRTLTPLMEDHPLFVSGNDDIFGGPSDDLSKNGQFLVLEDNPLAEGFNRVSVESEADFWKNRCVVELIRPKKQLQDEARAYYEINYGGRCLPDTTNETGKTHEFQNHFIAKGDVYYRSVPMNLQRVDNDQYTPLVNGSESQDSSYSNFSSVFVETEGWTDFFVSKERNYGRIHFVNPKEAETRRPSSIAFSEQTELGSYDTRWLSFPKVGNYKDFNYVYGGIDVMDYDGIFMNTFFSDSILKVPYNRNFLMDGETDALIASLKVFGTAQDVDYDGSTNGHPESLIRIDQDYYFVCPERREVVMLKGRKSPFVISDLNVSNYIKQEIANSNSGGDNIKNYLLGWDNVNKELVLSLYRGEVSQDIDLEADYLRSITFDLKSKKYWKSRYSYTSPLYSIIGDNMISWHKGGDGYTYPWVHGKMATKNNFFGHQHNTVFKCHVNDQINQSKKYDAIVTDSESPWRIKLSSGSDLANESLFSDVSPDRQKRYYGKWYAKIPRVDAGGENSQPPVTVPLSNNSHLFEVPVFPFNSYNGLFIHPEMSLKVGGGVFQTRSPIPDGHPFWKTTFPNGSRNTVYENSDFSEAGVSFVQNGGRRVATMCGRNAQGVSASYLNDAINGWSIVGAIPNSKNFIESTGFSDIVNDIVYQRSLSDVSPDVKEALNSTYNANVDIVDEHGFVRLADIQWPSDEVKISVVNALFAPLFGVHFGPQGVDNVALANTLIYGDATTTIVYNQWDLNQDGSVNIPDILEFLSEFGGQYSTADLLSLLQAFGTSSGESTEGPTGDGVFNIETANALAWWLTVQPNAAYNTEQPPAKKLYCSYTGPFAGRDMRGRTLTLEFSDSKSTDKKLFGIEVDYDLDVKSPRSPATTQKR